MAQVPIVAIDIIVFVLVVYLLRRLTRARSTRLPLPPGPPGLPIINNLLDWPSEKEWESLSQWAGIYGDIIHLNVGGTHIVALHSVDIGMELLQGKGSIYSDRPTLYVAGELVGMSETTFLLDDGPKLKESRRWFTQEIGSKQALARFEPMVQTRTKRFIKQLLADSGMQTDFVGHLLTLSSGIILDATYGYDVKDSQDKLLLLGQHTVVDMATASRPGAFVADIFPWIDRLPLWFPFTRYRQVVAGMRKRFIDFRDSPYEYTKKHMLTKESAQRSFVASQLQNQELTVEQEANLKQTASISFGAGSDTTAATINHFFFFMAKYPEIQTKAQEEIDRVIGNSRLPSMSDQANLPYVNALISEILRCSTIAPTGMAHKLRVNDVYKGYLLPKGTYIVSNLWHMSRDYRNYKNPEVFDPTRFLSDLPELDPKVYIFGFGRRICAGRVFAEQTLFLVVTALLATLRISKAKDAEGVEIEPMMKYHSTGLVVHLDPYAMKIKARSSSDVESLLMAESFDR